MNEELFNIIEKLKKDGVKVSIIMPPYCEECKNYHYGIYGIPCRLSEPGEEKNG